MEDAMSDQKSNPEIEARALCRIYGEDVLLETFGHLTPTAVERASKTYDLLEAWSDRSFKLHLNDDCTAAEFRNEVRDMGLREYRDYVIYGGFNIAFRDNQSAAFVKIKLGEFFR